MMKNYYENPPTAGLPMRFSDWLVNKKSLSATLRQQMNLPELSLTCSGTIALVTALTVLKARYPDRKQVIIPAYTCPLVALAIHHCGLTITLCDTAKDNIDFDFDKLSSLLSAQVLAVLPTHLGGRIANVSRVKQLAMPYNIIVIEDAAQALGANVGIDGDIVFFSLAVGKGLTLYEGGLLTANDPLLREQLAKQAALIPRKMGWELRRIAELVGYTALYHPFGLHFVYGNPKRHALKQGKWIEAVGDDFEFELPMHRVSRFRQAIAANAAARLPKFLEKTKQQALKRIHALRRLPGITVISDHAEQNGVWPIIMVLMPSKQIRDAALQTLWPSGLGVSRLFIHALPTYQYLRPIIPAISMPNAEDFADRMLTITNSLWLTDSDFDQICQTLKSHLSNRY